MASRAVANRNDRHKAGAARPRNKRREFEEYDQQQSYLERGNQQFREMVADHEGQAVFVALALGFGIGLALGYGMGGSRQEERWTDRIAAEGLGRRLLERVESLLPEAVTSRLGK
jgi:hypothetical protein